MGRSARSSSPEDFDECVASVRKAEEAGYSHAWFVDSQILWQDCFVYMTHALAQTERIVVGTAVTNPYTRHVDDDREHVRDARRAASRRLVLRHRARRQRRADDGPEAGQDGRCSPSRCARAARADGRPRTPRSTAPTSIPLARERAGIPIMMAATGPKNLRAAGALADRVMLYVGVERAVGALGDRARAGGRRGRRPRPGRGQALGALRRCGSATTRRTPGTDCRWAPAACANHIADTHAREPGARHARGDDAARREPRRLRLLRRAPRLGGRAHRAI